MNRHFEWMKAVIEQPSYPFLTHYRDDFYKHDRRYLEATDAPGSRYIWVVRETGTHLVKIGVHPGMHEEITAAMATCGPERREVYLVSDAGVTKLSDAKTKTLLQSYQYTVQGSMVFKEKRHLATLDVSVSRWSQGSQPTGTVHITGVQPYLSLETLVSLCQIGEREVIRKAGTLFVGTETITLDGQPLREMIGQQQAAMHHVQGTLQFEAGPI